MAQIASDLSFLLAFFKILSCYNGAGYGNASGGVFNNDPMACFIHHDLSQVRLKKGHQ
ncbi:MAG: hypothetical protein VXZ84_07120 [Planctomycetota bacterium]|nr:hypothetical protein [Planctomycetota bacterium]